MRLKYILLALCCMSSAMLPAQSLYLGSRDNHYVHIGYIDKRHWDAGLEHSVFSDKFAEQSLKAFAGYANSWQKLNYSGQAFYGSTYNKRYQQTGLLATADYVFIPSIGAGISIMPLYDSYYKYKTCYAVRFRIGISQQLDVNAEYTTIPEFRENEQRIRAGLKAHVGGLWVQPMVSIPVGNGDVSNFRFLVNCGFNINLPK